MFKKLLSTALAIAVVLSCISIVPVSAATYDAVTPLYETTFTSSEVTAIRDKADNTVITNDYGTITYYNGGWRIKTSNFGGDLGLCMAKDTWPQDLLKWTQTNAITDGTVAIEFDMAISNDSGVLGSEKDSNDSSYVKVNDKTFLEYKKTNGIHFAYIDAGNDKWYVDSNNPVVPEDGVLYRTGLYMNLDSNKLYTVLNGRNLYTNSLPADFAFSTMNIKASKTFQYFDNLKITYYPASTGTFAMTALAKMYNSSNAITVNFAEPVPANLTAANFTATVDGEEAAIEKVEKVSAYQAKVYFADLAKGTYTITPVGITSVSGATAAVASVVVSDAKIFDIDYDNLTVREDAMYRAFGEWNNNIGNFHIAQDESGNISLVNSTKQDNWSYALPITLTNGMGSIKVSFDAKTTQLDAAAEILRLWFARSNNSGDHQYFFTLQQNSDGTCVVDGKSQWATGGTDYIVDAADSRTMHSYELVVDMNAWKTNIIIDGVLKEKKDLPTNAELKTLYFDTRAGFAQLDNFQVTAIENSNAGFANDAEVVNGSNQMVLKANTAIDTSAVTADNFAVMNGDAEIDVTNVAFDTTKRVATLTLAAPCVKGSTYTVTSTGLTTLSGIATAATTANVVCVPEIQVVSKTLGEDGVVTVVVKNNTSAPVSATLIGAVYDSEEATPQLLDCASFSAGQIPAGKTATLYTRALDITSEGPVKAYLWKGISSAAPLTGVITF